MHFKKNIDKIYLYGLLLLAFIMPLHKAIFSWILILYAIFWIVSGGWNEKIKSLKNNFKTFLFLISLYFLYLIGLLCTSNIEVGLFDIQVKVCLFAIPFILSSISKKIVLKPVIFVFIAGCLLSFILSIGVALYQYIHTGSTIVFYYTKLSLIHHPSYLAMYIDFAIACLIWFEFDRKNTSLFYSKYITFLLIFIFSIFVGLLSSKMGIIILVLIFLFTIILFVSKYHKIKTGFALLALCFLFFSTLIFFNPEIYGRFDTARKSLLGQYTDPVDGTYNRKQVWKAGISIIMENSIIGVGTGDSKDELLKEFQKNNLKDAYEKKLNAHDQFIQTFISIGILGFIIILALFIIPFILAWKKKQWLFMIFLIIVFVNFLVESMLETQAGVVFYAFFNTLLFLEMKKE
ncbi:MAG: oligosaccharide repeat unit polymerase [Bacteroidetes bacterium]|nr:oligosaccharide repeat unit polymerase [Bacteroidota bacterium]